MKLRRTKKTVTLLGHPVVILLQYFYYSKMTFYNLCDYFLTRAYYKKQRIYNKKNYNAVTVFKEN